MKHYLTYLIILVTLGACGSGSGDQGVNTASDIEVGDSIPAIGALDPDSEFDIPCLVYHRFGDNRYPSTNIRMEQFRRHLEYLKENNFKTITLGKAIQLVEKKEFIEEKYVVITIDDGYKTVYENGFRLLQEYGFVATVFVNTESIGGNDYMGWQELGELQEYGIEIGNHSHDHSFFLNYPEESRYVKFREDLEEAQSRFSTHLGVTPDLYAYPYGEYDSRMKQILAENGFRGAAAQNSGVFNEGSDRLSIPRFPMNETYAELAGFREKVNMKALRVEKEIPSSPFYAENPPSLTILLEDENLTKENLQFFVAGSRYEVSWPDNHTLLLQSERQLTGRRVLYTVTVPDHNGKWRWFSHLWVNPAIPDQ